MPTILVVEDDPGVSDVLVGSLKNLDGFQVQLIGTRDLTSGFFTDQLFQFVLAALDTRDASGNNLLDYLTANCPQTKCIVFAKEASIKDSVIAIKRGAFDFIGVSENIDDLAEIIRNAPQSRKLTGLKRRREDGARGFKFGELVGESPKIQKVFKAVEKVAQSGSTILITGESGTGKELIARAIHYNSDRRDKPLVIINCGAIPGELLESELFGHEKGAFTGAHRTRIGRFEMANEGTIFLDEIGDMSPDLQVKLLRVLQEQTFERVGSTKSQKVDIRVIAATNKDLISSIEERTFREDLYYRLNVIPISIPPLRERKSDIPLLIDFFLKRLGGRRRSDQKRVKTFSDEARKAMMRYDWPGNVRELENMIERLSVLVEEPTIELSDLPERVCGKSVSEPPSATITLEEGIGFNDAVEHYQRTLILQALNQTNWIKAKAAELLKMNRTTLVEKIKKMKLEATD